MGRSVLAMLSVGAGLEDGEILVPWSAEKHENRENGRFTQGSRQALLPGLCFPKYENSMCGPVLGNSP